ncbi:MAG: hypothetical protein DIU78_023335 [Pseudomonadota bacterium]
MSLGNTFENDLAKLIFQATGIGNIADNASSAPLTNLYVSLHTDDPGEAGDQETNEADYGDYARVGVARSGSGWTVSNNTITNAAEIAFPECSSGNNTITHFAIGTASSGGGKILVKGALSSSLNVSAGITPKFAAGEIDITVD